MFWFFCLSLTFFLLHYLIEGAQLPSGETLNYKDRLLRLCYGFDILFPQIHTHTHTYYHWVWDMKMHVLWMTSAFLWFSLRAVWHFHCNPWTDGLSQKYLHTHVEYSFQCLPACCSLITPTHLFFEVRPIMFSLVSFIDPPASGCSHFIRAKWITMLSLHRWFQRTTRPWPPWRGPSLRTCCLPILMTTREGTECFATPMV